MHLQNGDIDKKKGKKQIVIGLLAASDGTPVTVEVFEGNIQNPATFASQINKCKKRFGCEKVTFVGDRGMIKSGQIKDLQEHGFSYITSITKVQIKKLIDKGVLQYSFFDKDLLEIKDDGVRYLLRRNPSAASRNQKF